MQLASPVFKNNDSIPAKYTCDGENVNPPFLIDNVPKGTESLVLIIDDPDAPSGIWDHWLLWNIDPSVSLIEEDSVPGGSVEGRNSFGENAYGGPCPPHQLHHYRFKLYALDKKLDIDSSHDKKDLQTAMEGHVLDQTQLVAFYKS
jgi:hypothetical protein